MEKEEILQELKEMKKKLQSIESRLERVEKGEIAFTLDVNKMPNVIRLTKSGISPTE